MGKSVRGYDPPWSDLPEGQWKLLWEGERTGKKYCALLWEAGHKTVTLFPGASITPIHPILRMTGDGIQTQHTQIPHVKRIPTSVRKTIQAYLNMVDWRHIQEGAPRGMSKIGPLHRSLPSDGSNGKTTIPHHKRWEGESVTSSTNPPDRS